MTDRGIRNNNPLNIDRHPGDTWQGMSEDQSSDSRFLVFKTPVYGIRAGAVTLMTYQRKYYLNTVRKMINRWAPPSENKTTAYALHVANVMGVGVDDIIDVDSVDIMKPMIIGMIEVECSGYHYPDKIIMEALNKAGIKDAPVTAPQKKKSVQATVLGGAVVACSTVSEHAPVIKSFADQLKEYTGSAIVDHAVSVLVGLAAAMFAAGVIGGWIQHLREK